MQNTFLWALLAAAAVSTKETVIHSGRCGREYGGLTCQGSTFRKYLFERVYARTALTCLFFIAGTCCSQ
jgi:hypothetical protein